MKTLLTCDAVFEALTSGPVIAGSSEAAAIEEHLTACDSCRQLAEALRPATHLVHEALGEEAARGLPMYLDAHDTVVTEIMQRVETLPSSGGG